MIRLQHIIKDKVQEKKQKELARVNAQRQKNSNSKTKNHPKQSTMMVLPASLQVDPSAGQINGSSENRKASAGNGAELNRMVNIKTGGDLEQGGENKRARKMTRDLDNLV